MSESDNVGFSVRLLSLRKTLTAMIKPSKYCLTVVIPMSEEPVKVTDLLDTMSFVGDIIYDKREQLYVWRWFEHGFESRDDNVNEIVDLLLSEYTGAILLHDLLADAE